MSNEYFNNSGAPGGNSHGSSAVIRGEFTAVSNGFAKLPILSGNGGKLVAVNPGGTALLASAAAALGLVDTTSAQTLSTKTLASPVITGAPTDTVHTLSGPTPVITPANGAIQTWTLSGNSTPTLGTMADGQAVVLLIDDGSGYAITWTNVTTNWITTLGATPSLKTTGYNIVVLLKFGSTVYGVA